MPRILIIFLLCVTVFFVSGCIRFGPADGPSAKIDNSGQDTADTSDEEDDVAAELAMGKIGEKNALTAGEITELLSQVKGSCDSRPVNNQCLDYLGIDWSWENIQLNCSSEGMRSDHLGCYQPSLGGCLYNQGDNMANVIWTYADVSDNDTEEVFFAKKACEAIPGATWVTDRE